MRVIAGSRRSMPLQAPPGTDTRPTQDRIKETLFNVLQNDVPGSEFLDLFAGSGGIAIEALSRGAKHAVLVEKSRRANEFIRKNLAFTRFEEEAELMETDVFTALERLRKHEKFDIVFMDPPYGLMIEEEVLGILNTMDSITGDTLIIIETDNRRELSFIEKCGYSVTKIKKYKTNQHIFIKKINF